MGAKKIVYGEEARERLLEGIDTVANAIKSLWDQQQGQSS